MSYTENFSKRMVPPVNTFHIAPDFARLAFSPWPNAHLSLSDSGPAAKPKFNPERPKIRLGKTMADGIALRRLGVAFLAITVSIMLMAGVVVKNHMDRRHAAAELRGILP